MQSEEINYATIPYNTHQTYFYLEGLENCFSEGAIKQLKTRGIRCCPAFINGVNKRNSDPFSLKRIMVNSQ